MYCALFQDVSESQKRRRGFEEGASGGHSDTETYEAEGLFIIMYQCKIVTFTVINPFLPVD
jgi:hypothetical protein